MKRFYICNKTDEALIGSYVWSASCCICKCVKQLQLHAIYQLTEQPPVKASYKWMKNCTIIKVVMSRNKFPSDPIPDNVIAVHINKLSKDIER